MVIYIMFKDAVCRTLSRKKLIFKLKIFFFVSNMIFYLFIVVVVDCFILTYLWTRECVSKWCLSVKLFLHSLHWYGRSVECNSKCVFRQCLWANDLPQWTHTWGLSPVWTRAWVVKWCFSKNDFPHSSHAYGRSFGAPPVANSCSSAVRISSFGFISRTGIQ